VAEFPGFGLIQEYAAGGGEFPAGYGGDVHFQGDEVGDECNGGPGGVEQDSAGFAGCDDFGDFLRNQVRPRRSSWP